MPTPRSDDASILDVGEPIPLVDIPCQTGEGPLWHEGEQALYWLDIPTGRLFRYDPATGQNDLAYQHDAQIGGYTFQDDGSFLLFCTAGKVLRWRDGDVITVIDEIPEERDTRFNDVIADPAGRVYCGTMPGDDHHASLYRLDTDGTMTRVFDDIGLANGMGFTEDQRTMYFTDTRFRCIYRLGYDESSGELSSRAPLVRTPQDNGAPDGMAVDVTDTIWSARYGGGDLFRYSPDGELTGVVKLPVRNVTSLAFGGRDYRTAFVTTATGGKPRSEETGEHAGSLFSIDLGVQGKPPFRSRVRV